MSWTYVSQQVDAYGDSPQRHTDVDRVVMRMFEHAHVLVHVHGPHTHARIVYVMSRAGVQFFSSPHFNCTQCAIAHHSHTTPGCAGLTMVRGMALTLREPDVTPVNRMVRRWWTLQNGSDA